MFKSAQSRVKDRRDVEVALPMLDRDARRWLRGIVERINPQHPWVRDL